MSRRLDRTAINNELLDRRVKLTREQKKEIRLLVAHHSTRAKLGFLGEAISQRILAKRYGVSRRTIQFILDDRKLVENKKRRAERGGAKQYYSRDKWKLTMRDHRAYKRKLLAEGLIEVVIN